jgi:hypothetical protein
MKTLVLDIETRPMLANVWRMWDENVGLPQVVEWGSMICFGAKWHGSPKTMVYSEYDKGGREGMVQKAWELMDAADAIIHFNGRAFDIKILQREMVLQELAPPSPHHDIDLLTVVRKQFKFETNRLENVAQRLLGEGKLDTGGFELWRGWMNGDKQSIKKMKSYCAADVELTERVYDRLLPWVHNHPNRVLIDGGFFGCHYCGSDNLQKRGLRHKTTGSYQQYQCQDCGGWSVDTKRSFGVGSKKA